MLQASLTVLSNWATLVENMQASPKEFYSQVEEFVKKRDIPELQISRIMWKESGVLSADREYLRLTRGRYLYDICAAPFGTGFFFSSWMAEKSPSPIWAIGGFFVLAILAFYTFFAFVYVAGFSGFLFWTMGLVGIFVVLIFLLSQEDSQFADYVFVVPYLGSFLEKLCRPNTYFRSDTESMFRTMVHNAVLEAVDATTKARGARELTSDERKPILRDFFKR